MKTNIKTRNQLGPAILTTLMLLISSLSFAADVPSSFTLDGQLFADTAGTAPLLDSNITVKIQILDNDRTCVLYEESQSVNTVFSKGYFSIQVGSDVSDVKRSTGDSALTMATVFQNLNNVTGKKLSDGTVCTVTAAGGKRRYVRVTVAPASLAGAPRVLSPDLTIDSVPNSIVAERAESLQGLRSTDFLKVNTASGSALTQANLESVFTSTTRFNALTSVVDGTSTNYMRTTAAGAQVPVFTGAPTSPAQGSMWFDTSDQKLKYRTGTGTTEIVGTTSSGTGTVTSVAAAATSGNPITIGGTSTVAPTIDIPAATTSVSGYLKATDWTIFNNKQTSTLADGSIWIGNASTVATARAVSGDVSLSNTGVTAVNKIKGVTVSATAPTDGQILKYVSGTTSWTPTGFSIGDLKTAAGTQQFAGSTACTAAQTLTWSSLTDTFVCSNIAGLDGGVITTGTVAAARLPASASAWTISSADIYRATGNVGIGNSAPSSTLYVYDSTATTGNTRLVVRSGAGQSTSLQEWSNNAGTAAASMDNTGTLRANGGIFSGATRAVALTGAAGSLALRNDGFIKWVYNADAGAGTVDVGLYRNAAGVLEVNDGNTAGTLRDLQVRNATVASSVEGAAAYANSTAAYTIPDTSVNIRRLDLNANTTITLPAFTTPAAKMYSLTLFLRQDATGSRTVAFAGNSTDTIKWDSGTAPAISTTAGKITVVQLMKASDETVWYGSVVWKEN